MPHLLLLEDDIPLAHNLKWLLESQHYRVSWTSRVGSAVALHEHQRIDLAIVDRMLPDGDGLKVVENLSQDAGQVPCIVLTHRSQVTERIRALRQGAVDCVPKPFSREEVLLKVERLLQHQTGMPSHRLTYGEIQLFPSTGQLMLKDKPYQLRRREAQVLTVFMRHPGQILTKEQLIQHVWQLQADQPNEETMEVYVRRLRSRLPSELQPCLQTIRGFGYRLR